jgi:hypothetical protein
LLTLGVSAIQLSQCVAQSCGIFAAKNSQAVETDSEKFTRFLAILFRSANPPRQKRRLFALSDSPNCARLGLIEIATCANEIVGNPDVFRYTL